jgi:recombination protein RecT
MAQELQKQETTITTTPTTEISLRQALDEGMVRNSEQFAAALGGDAQKIQRWKTLLMMEINRKPDLAKCDPGSLIASMLEAAQFGLEFGPKQHSYLVPYDGKCTFQPGYRGLVHLAKRSGEVKHIYAEVVLAKDQFDQVLGLNKDLTHIPAKGERGPMTDVYAVVKYADGSDDFEVMTKAQVEHIKGKSKSKTGPWSTDYDEMAKKAVIKRLCKRLDISVELAGAIDTDDRQYTVEPASPMRMPEQIEGEKA